MKAKVSEIFQSIQGEGLYAGVRQVFVRFGACNISCAWCDTVVPQKEMRELGAEEIMSEITALKKSCHSVSFTGGEPLLEKDMIAALCPRVRKEGLRVYLDTNGVLHEALAEVISGVDVIAMDIKLPSSSQCPPLWDEHERFLKTAFAKEVFVKIVVASGTSDEDMRRAAELVAGVCPTLPVILQPNSYELDAGAVARAQDLQQCCADILEDVRVLPQMHKLLGLR